MLNRVQKVFEQVSGRNDLTLEENMNIDELGLSSLGRIELICALEDEFSVAIPNSAMVKFRTVNHVLRFLKKNAGQEGA